MTNDFIDFNKQLVTDLEKLSADYHFEFNRIIKIHKKIYDPKGNAINEPMPNMAYICSLVIKINDIAK